MTSSVSTCFSVETNFSSEVLAELLPQFMIYLLITSARSALRIASSDNIHTPTRTHREYPTVRAGPPWAEPLPQVLRAPTSGDRRGAEPCWGAVEAGCFRAPAGVRWKESIVCLEQSFLKTSRCSFKTSPQPTGYFTGSV